MTNAAATLTLSDQWLNTSISPTYANSTNATNTVFANAQTGFFYHDYWYPYYVPQHTYQTLTVTARPIKLTMNEVERLRVAAKKDKDLKKTLAKFTDHIEVVVDFE